MNNHVTRSTFLVSTILALVIAVFISTSPGNTSANIWDNILIWMLSIRKEQTSGACCYGPKDCVELSESNADNVCNQMYEGNWFPNYDCATITDFRDCTELVLTPDGGLAIN